MRYSTLVKGFSITALSAALIACGGSGSGSGSSDDTVSGETTGTLSLGLTDAPVDNLSEVVITVTGVTLKPEDGEAISFDFESPKTIDLLTLQEGTVETLLGEEEVEAGAYNWVRLHLSEENGDLYVMEDTGGQASLFVPSGFQTGLKLVSGFTVPAGGSASFTIDFDVRKSIVNPQGNNAKGDYFLKPTLRLIDNNEAGTIAGTVDESTLVSVECESAQDFAGLVYIYEGSDVDPLQLGVEEGEPMVTAPVNYDSEESAYTFTAAFIAEGDYTVSYSCDSDDPESDEETVEFFDTQNVSVTADTTTEVNFEVSGQ